MATFATGEDGILEARASAIMGRLTSSTTISLGSKAGDKTRATTASVQRVNSAWELSCKSSWSRLKRVGHLLKGQTVALRHHRPIDVSKRTSGFQSVLLVFKVCWSSGLGFSFMTEQQFAAGLD
jgi:hypothetical protein